jgi:DNA-binding GntR family transcriptional regulator
MVGRNDNRSWVKAYKWIRDEINRGNFETGTPLHENMISEAAGVSRTPVREALKNLEVDGYVKIVPTKGAFVAGLSMRDLREIYEIRKLLEPFAALSSTTLIPESEIDALCKTWRSLESKAKANKEWDLSLISKTDLNTHLTIINYNSNERIKKIISPYHAQIWRFQFMSAQSLADIIDTIGQHLELLECLKKRNSVKMQHLLYDHIVSSEANIMRGFYMFDAEKNGGGGAK